jgi:hypothetical protein
LESGRASSHCHADLEVTADEIQLWLTLANLAALVRQQLFIFRDLWAWLDNPLEGPSVARQLAEQLPMPLVW